MNVIERDKAVSDKLNSFAKGITEVFCDTIKDNDNLGIETDSVVIEISNKKITLSELAYRDVTVSFRVISFVTENDLRLE